jgi:hypothetical protein
MMPGLLTGMDIAGSAAGLHGVFLLDSALQMIRHWREVVCCLAHAAPNQDGRNFTMT